MSARFAASPLSRAKALLPIPALWHLFALPGKLGKSCFCPFHRNENTPALSIYERGGEWKFHCFGGCNEGREGDAADFVALHYNCSPEEGVKRLIEMAGILSYRNEQSNTRIRHGAEARKKARAQESWPRFATPTVAEIRAIADLRALSPESVSIAVDRGLLFCADSREARCWILSDSTRKNAQARRIDGRYGRD